MWKFVQNYNEIGEGASEQMPCTGDSESKRSKQEDEEEEEDDRCRALFLSECGAYTIINMRRLFLEHYCSFASVELLTCPCRVSEENDILFIL